MGQGRSPMEFLPQPPAFPTSLWTASLDFHYLDVLYNITSFNLNIFVFENPMVFHFISFPLLDN